MTTQCTHRHSTLPPSLPLSPSMYPLSAKVHNTHWASRQTHFVLLPYTVHMRDIMYDMSPTLKGVLCVTKFTEWAVYSRDREKDGGRESVADRWWLPLRPSSPPPPRPPRPPSRVARGDKSPLLCRPVSSAGHNTHPWGWSKPAVTTRQYTYKQKTRKFEHTCTNTRTRTHIYMYIHMFAHMDAYTCSHGHAHTHTETTTNATGSDL